LQWLAVLAVGELGRELDKVGVSLLSATSPLHYGPSVQLPTHSDGQVLLVELLLVQDVLGFEHRVEDVRLAILVPLP